MADETSTPTQFSGPPPSEQGPSFRDRGFDSVRLAVGATIILFGVLLLLGRTMQLDWIDRTGWWPLLAIVYGVARMVSGQGYRFSHGLAFALLGVWGLLNNFNVLRYEDSWPLVFVIVGGSLVVGAFTTGWTATAATPAVSTAATYDLTTREGRRAARAARRMRYDSSGFGFVWILIVWGAIFGMVQGNFRGPRQRDSRYESAGMIRRSVVMSQARTIHEGAPFEGADLTAVMGENDLDLTRATIPPGQEPVINVHVVMGQVNLRVPSDWIVEQRLTPVMGDAQDFRRSRTPADTDVTTSGDAGPKHVIIRGGVVMGEFAIRN
jgi:hypothetical protein